MKADRRHELRENALVASVKEASAFVRRNGNYIAWGLLAAALIAFIAVYAVNRQRTRRLELQMEYDRLMARRDNKPADWLKRMMDLADQDSDERIAAQACVAAGNANTEMFALGVSAAGQDPPEALAERYYNKALSFEEQRAAIGQAHYGLGKLRESQGDLAAAGAEYRKVTELADLAGYPVATLAQAALDALKDRRPVAMIPRRATTQPATAPATAPATQPAFDLPGFTGEALP